MDFTIYPLSICDESSGRRIVIAGELIGWIPDSGYTLPELVGIKWMRSLRATKCPAGKLQFETSAEHPSELIVSFRPYLCYNSPAPPGFGYEDRIRNSKSTDRAARYVLHFEQEAKSFNYEIQPAPRGEFGYVVLCPQEEAEQLYATLGGNPGKKRCNWRVLDLAEIIVELMQQFEIQLAGFLNAFPAVKPTTIGIVWSAPGSGGEEPEEDENTDAYIYINEGDGPEFEHAQTSESDFSHEQAATLNAGRLYKAFLKMDRRRPVSVRKLDGTVAKVSQLNAMQLVNDEIALALDALFSSDFAPVRPLWLITQEFHDDHRHWAAPRTHQ